MMLGLMTRIRLRIHGKVTPTQKLFVSQLKTTSVTRNGWNCTK